MVRVLFDNDGNKVEVPDEKELKELQESTKKVEDIQKEIDAIKEKVGAKEGQDLGEVLDQMKEDANPNFTAMRKTLAAKGKELEKATKLLDENKIEFGKKNLEIDVKKITSDAQEAGAKAANKMLIENELNKRLANFDEKQKPVVRKFYDKLVAGEEVTLENLDEFFKQSISASGIEIDSGGGTYVDGQPPVFAKKDGDFSETERGKEIGKQIFGEDFGKTAEERKEGGEK